MRNKWYDRIDGFDMLMGLLIFMVCVVFLMAIGLLYGSREPTYSELKATIHAYETQIPR